jgi:predicted nucleic acid-binding protein
VSVLADTSVWVDHLRDGDATLAALLDAGLVRIHPFIIGEIALGHLTRRKTILDALSDLPRLTVATDTEALAFIEASSLAGRGIGYVDAHLLAALKLTPGILLWTRDRRLAKVAAELSLAADENALRP